MKPCKNYVKSHPIGGKCAKIRYHRWKVRQNSVPSVESAPKFGTIGGKCAKIRYHRLESVPKFGTIGGKCAEIRYHRWKLRRNSVPLVEFVQNFRKNVIKSLKNCLKSYKIFKKPLKIS